LSGDSRGTFVDISTARKETEGGKKERRIIMFDRDDILELKDNYRAGELR